MMTRSTSSRVLQIPLAYAGTSGQRCILAFKLAGAPKPLCLSVCSNVLSVVLPGVVWMKCRDSVRHSTRRQPRLLAWTQSIYVSIHLPIYGVNPVIGQTVALATLLSICLLWASVQGTASRPSVTPDRLPERLLHCDGATAVPQEGRHFSGHVKGVTYLEVMRETFHLPIHT